MNSDDEYDFFGDEENDPAGDEEELRDKGISEDDSQGSLGYMIEEQGPSFVAEAKIFERVSGRRGLGTEIGGTSNRLKDIQKIANRENLSESEKFTIVAITYFNNFRDSDIISFPEGEIKGILSLIPRIQNLKYKNPLGIIFGYYVLEKGGDRIEISKTRFNNFVKVIYPKLEEGIITLPDVIRYARYLQKII